MDLAGTLRAREVCFRRGNVANGEPAKHTASRCDWWRAEQPLWSAELANPAVHSLQRVQPLGG